MFDIILIVENRGGNVRNNKGQALIEFVIILPILLILILGIIDIGRIIYEKNRLENINNDVVDLINNKKLSDSEIENKLKSNYSISLSLEIERKEKNIIIKLSREIDVLTPGLGLAIDDPYKVEVSRVINNE
jgi:competence protein ComGC